MQPQLDPGIDLTLESAFARVLPELSVPWQAARPECPELLVLNQALSRELGVNPDELRTESGVRVLLGNELAAGSTPVAQLYSGHQFGSYVSRLGDGRALLLGEIRDAHGQLRDLHLKGSGRTPFARADGFAAVGPMLREYLMGEAMAALGVPTTRALAVVATGRRVVRDDLLPGAVLVRTASSHLRVGTFQYARSLGDLELLRRVADFAIERHAPELAGSSAPYLGLLKSVIAAQAGLVSSWMLIGFVHGVLNTDNVAISGETIDYGPCAFLDAYDPAATFSSIDQNGRYAYGAQPSITLWNLTRFAEMLLPLLSEDESVAQRLASEALGEFSALYETAWLEGMRVKLGVAVGGDDDVVANIAGALLQELQRHRIDYTQFFRSLAAAGRGDSETLLGLYPGDEGPGAWFEWWISLNPDSAAMDLANPVYIPRNLLVDEALEAANEGDLEPFERLLEVLSDPLTARPGFERYAAGSPPGSRPHRTYCGT
ncbi:YdiU family protein [Leucobacter viscericola]|uniref:Protein nucleotidyltransferase YdiU n=1 Tax=Leucobacter viscericola TaxID=2714935 RepID=A0A6G7XII5_9MICO|nr:YdiU family protein [Leucobacter viscericola]QIK64187.1 YdiU family protein [Leucobacter viscericola]